MSQIELAVIGGSGLYQMAEMATVETVELDTPFGRPSAPITIGESPLGVLYIEAPVTAPGYDEGDMVVLRTATNTLAVALQRRG